MALPKDLDPRENEYYRDPGMAGRPLSIVPPSQRESHLQAISRAPARALAFYRESVPSPVRYVLAYTSPLIFSLAISVGIVSVAQVQGADQPRKVEAPPTPTVDPWADCTIYQASIDDLMNAECYRQQALRDSKPTNR